MSVLDPTRGDGRLCLAAPSQPALLTATPGGAAALEPALRADEALAAPVTRWGAFLELTKPRISAMVLVVVAVAGWAAREGSPNALLLLHALIGTGLVAASSSAFNQWLERRLDARMKRTRRRPLPAGRLTEAEVVRFGVATLLGGLAYLAALVNVLSALLAFATWALYVTIYTPLKTRTSWNTHVGAVAGALPVAIGWAAVEGAWDVRAATLFLIVFLWQFPHFMAIAWLYRGEYAEAGMKMLPVVDPTGRRAAALAVGAALALIPVSLAPALAAPGAALYAYAALVLGVFQFAAAATFFAARDALAARRLLHASLIYLPALLALWMFAPAS